MATFTGPPSMLEFPSIGAKSPRELVAEILGISNNDSWGITDTIGDDLVMIRYQRDADKTLYGKLNGIVIDLKAKVPVCRDYGHAPVVVSDQITVNDANEIVLNDINGDTHRFDVSRIKFRRKTEGTKIRVFRWNGQTIICTHNKFLSKDDGQEREVLSTSQWGSSLSFLDIYDALGGPTGDELFHPMTLTSPVCYLFILVHPDLMVASKQDVGVGYLAFMGAKQMWSVNVLDCPYKQTDVRGLDESEVPYHPVGQLHQDWLMDPRPNAGYLPSDFMLPSFVTQLPSQITKPVTYYPRSYDASNPDHLSFINSHLKNGYWTPSDPALYNSMDPRLSSGEALTMFVVDADEQLEEIAVEVRSSPYYWRKETIRGNSPHLWTRFTDLLNAMYINTETPEGFNKFVGIEDGMLTVSGFPLMQSWPVDSIIERVKSSPMTLWPVVGASGEIQIAGPHLLKADTEEGRQALRVYNIWAAMIAAVPLAQQPVVADLYYRFYSDRAVLINFLSERAMNGEYESQDLPVYYVNKIQRVRNKAQEDIDQGNNKTEDGRVLSFNDLINYYVQEDILREKTNVIRKMLRQMKTIQITEERDFKTSENVASSSS